MASLTGAQLNDAKRVATGTANYGTADMTQRMQGVASFLSVMNFLAENPERISGIRTSFGTVEFFEKAARRYFKGRFRHEVPTSPQTVTDSMVSYVMHVAFNYPYEKLSYLEIAHKDAMAAEIAVGDLLERFLAGVLEPRGWTWCSGTLVKATDFLKYSKSNNMWSVLQIKNRDNSENSSSAGYRNLQVVKSWFRTFSRTGKTNWEAFPIDDVDTRLLLNEQQFKIFVQKFYAPLIASHNKG